MKTGAAKLKVLFFSMAVVLFFLTSASGYLYHQNQNYQYQNQRLIVLNDSILSENIELKNALQRKASAAFQPLQAKIKTGGRK